jgi:hypothetical protein
LQIAMFDALAHISVMEPLMLQESPTISVENGHANGQRYQRPRFTPEQARLAGLRSAQAKAARKLAQLNATPPQAKPASVDNLDAFKRQTIARARKGIKAILDQIDTEMHQQSAKARCACGLWVTLPLPDSKRVKEMTASAKDLATIERETDNRPLPGALRPRVAKGTLSAPPEPQQT